MTAHEHERCAVFTCDARATVLVIMQAVQKNANAPLLEIVRRTRPYCDEHKRCARNVVRCERI